MFRFSWAGLIAVSIVTSAYSQSPSPSSQTEVTADSLSPADLEAIIPLLKKNFTNPQALNDVELNRAAVEGLLIQLPNGMMLLSRSGTAQEAAAPFYNEVLDGHAGYLRLGTLNTGNLQALDKALADFAPKKVDAAIVDLRASGGASDFAVAAEYAKRFCPKGKPLFTLRKPDAHQDRVFASDREPAFQGLITVLADEDTSGTGEALAGALRVNEKGLIIGQTTAGRGVEYSDLPLPSGKILRVASGQVMLPGDRPLFPDGLKPDLPVEMSLVDKRQIFQHSGESGMGPFIYESERPHINEAALIAGTNPELDAIEAAQRRRDRSPGKVALHDVVLQRALDLVTSLEVYQKR